MATYNLMAKQNTNEMNPGSNWVYLEINFSEHNLAQNDVARLFKVKNGWILNDSYYKIAGAGTSGTDWEVGYSGATTDIVDITDPTTAGAWTRGSDTPAAQKIFSANDYVQVKVTDGAEGSGILRVLIQIIAPNDLAEPVNRGAAW